MVSFTRRPIYRHIGSVIVTKVDGRPSELQTRGRQQKSSTLVTIQMYVQSDKERLQPGGGQAYGRASNRVPLTLAQEVKCNQHCTRGTVQCSADFKWVKAAPPNLKPNPFPCKADPIHLLPTKMWCESERGLAGQRTAGCLLGHGDSETSVYNLLYAPN